MLEEGVGILVEWPEKISLKWSKRIHIGNEGASHAGDQERDFWTEGTAKSRALEAEISQPGSSVSEEVVTGVFSGR